MTAYEEFLVRCHHCGTIEIKLKDKMWVLCSKCNTALDIMNKFDLTEFIEKILKPAYHEAVREQRRWSVGYVTMKQLWIEIHIIEPNLRLRNLKKILWFLHNSDFQKYDFSRGSIAVSHVSRYGIHTKNGVYFYFNLRGD